jgi:predicted metal-dependent hydrolase
MVPLLRKTLDLFGPRPEPTSDAVKTQPPSRAAPTDDALQTPWRHPQANCDIHLGEHAVAYVFKHARRRSIGMQVGLEGLSVRAPYWVSRRAVEDALLDRADWIVCKLQESSLRLRERAQRALVWQDGMRLPYLGGSLHVRCEPALARGAPAWLETEQAPVLRLRLGADATPAQLQQAVRAALQAQARNLFAERLTHFAPLLGVRWSRLMLSQARTRWGSANSSGVIRLNWRLVHLPLAVIDYVVVHELSHLREMNHSPKFWAIVASVLPDYKERQRALKDDALPLWPQA